MPKVTGKGGKRITSADVAREAGISRTTVGFVLTNSPHAERISAATKKRIYEAVERLGYTGSQAATALRRGYSNHVVMLAVTWGLAAGYGQTVLMSEAVANRGLSLILHVAKDGEEAESFLQDLPSLDPYGLMFLWDTAALPVARLLELQSQGLPIVDLLPSDLDAIPCVTADREDGFCKTVKHLVGLGHKRIGMILDTANRSKTSNRKLAGYRRALDAEGIPFDPALLEEVSQWGFEGGYEALPRMLDRSPDITAVIGINDPMAIGAMVAANERGLSVPGNLSIAGHGAYVEGSYVRPAITSAGPSASLAQAAVDMLVTMRHKPGNKPDSTYEPMDLIVRDSTGPAPCR